MTTLAGANSLFELAFGLNALIPLLAGRLDDVKALATDSILRKLQEHQPDFTLNESDRIGFVDFFFKLNRGLKRARVFTGSLMLATLTSCAVSLGALVWGASDPKHEVSATAIYGFVGWTMLALPLLYYCHRAYLRRVYRAIAQRSLSGRDEAAYYREVVTLILGQQERSRHSEEYLAQWRKAFAKHKRRARPR